MTGIDDSLATRWYQQKFGVRRSIRYHQRRRAFFDSLDQTGNMLSVIFGSAAVYGVLESNHKSMALLSAGAVTVLSAINLVIGSTRRAREHWDLARRFSALEQKMLCDPSEDALRISCEERLSIETDEPPTLRILDCICHNEVARAEGFDSSEIWRIRWWQRVFAPLIDIRDDLVERCRDPETSGQQAQ